MTTEPTNRTSKRVFETPYVKVLVFHSEEGILAASSRGKPEDINIVDPFDEELDW